MKKCICVDKLYMTITLILILILLAGARPRAVVQRDGGPGRVQAVRNQRARMRANGKLCSIKTILILLLYSVGV